MDDILLSTVHAWQRQKILPKVCWVHAYVVYPPSGLPLQRVNSSSPLLIRALVRRLSERQSLKLKSSITWCPHGGKPGHFSQCQTKYQLSHCSLRALTQLQQLKECCKPALHLNSSSSLSHSTASTPLLLLLL